MYQLLTPPTDSLYKFTAVFCLALIISSMLAIVSMSNAHNRLVYEGSSDMLDFYLSSDDKVNAEAFGRIVMSLIKASKNNVEAWSWVLLALFAAGCA